MKAKLYFCVPSPLKKLVLALQSLKMSCFYFTFCSWSYKTTNKVSGWRNFSPATAKYVSGKRALDTVMKERSAAVIDVHSKRAEVITLDEENRLWSKNVLGDENGKQLVETLVHLFGLHFALRGGKEHRQFCWTNSQVALKYDDEGEKYLEYSEAVSKNNAGAGLKKEKLSQKLLGRTKMLIPRDASCVYTKNIACMLW